MKRETNRRFRIPLFVSMGALALLFLFFSVSYQVSLRSLFVDVEMKLFNERKLLVDLLCDESVMRVDNEAVFTQFVINAFERIDQLNGSYGAVFDKKFNIISVRSPQFPEAPFNPLDYPELLTMMNVLDRGETTIVFDKANVPDHNLHIYFRKTGDLVVFTGITQYAVESWFAEGVTNAAQYLFIASIVCLIICGTGMILERRYRKNAVDAGTIRPA